MAIRAKSKKTLVQTKLTSEEEEREFRQKRGRLEEMKVKPLNKFAKPFDTYVVHTETGVPYTVEIRTLKESGNSCSCPDFLVNTLSTCKHIEAVLLRGPIICFQGTSG